MPDVLKRISQRDIASYIGVTPEALSRHLRQQVSTTMITT
ncbi:MAG: hypothetical protein ACI4UA_05315 [Bacteroidaceae bacterium]